MNRNCLQCSLLWERYYRASADKLQLEEQLKAAGRNGDRASFADIARRKEHAGERTFLARLEITNHRLVH